MGECEDYGFSHAAISNVCSGKRKSHKGFIWKKLEDYNEDETFNFDIQKANRKPIIQYDLENIKVSEYLSAKEIFEKSNEFFKIENIRKACRTGNPYKGFIFKYKTF